MTINNSLINLNSATYRVYALGKSGLPTSNPDALDWYKSFDQLMIYPQIQPRVPGTML